MCLKCVFFFLLCNYRTTDHRAEEHVGRKPWTSSDGACRRERPSLGWKLPLSILRSGLHSWDTLHFWDLRGGIRDDTPEMREVCDGKESPGNPFEGISPKGKWYRKGDSGGCRGAQGGSALKKWGCIVVISEVTKGFIKGFYQFPLISRRSEMNKQMNKYWK